MATLIGIIGSPGTGKTYGVKTLDPEKTFIFDCDKKGLSHKGWRSQYSTTAKNLVVTSDIEVIARGLISLPEKLPNVKYVVIDTINGCLSDQLMLAKKKPGFSEWMDMANDAYELYDIIRTKLPDDMYVFILQHEVYDKDFGKRRALYPGKALTRLNVTGKFNYLLFTRVEAQGDGKNKYLLQTQTDGTTEARSTEGVFPFEIPNDFQNIVNSIIKGENEVD